MENVVIDRIQLARALGVPAAELTGVLIRLTDLGFPRSVDNQQQGWTLSSLLDWAITQQERMVDFIGVITTLQEEQKLQ